MPGRQVIAAGVVAGAILLTGLQPARAEGRSWDDRGWHFELEPYGFVPFVIDGDVTTETRKLNFNVGLSDLFDKLRFAAALRFEAWKDRVGLVLDGRYVRLGDTLNPRSGPKIDLTSQLFLGDLLAGLKLFRSRHAALKLLAGVRGVSLRNELDIGSKINRDRTIGYAKFVGAAYLPIHFSDLFGIELQGLANTPDFGWSLTGLMDFNFSSVALKLGYRWERIHHEGGKATIDARTHGPYLGVAFQW